MILNGGSVSKLSLILDINGKVKLRCNLKRHLAPTLVGKITRSLPLTGHAHIIENSLVYFETSVNAGLERASKEFKKGDIAFLSVAHAICFFHSDSKTQKDMSIIGKILDDPKLLSDVKSGDEIALYFETGS